MTGVAGLLQREVRYFLEKYPVVFKFHPVVFGADLTAFKFHPVDSRADLAAFEFHPVASGKYPVVFQADLEDCLADLTFRRADLADWRADLRDSKQNPRFGRSSCAGVKGGGYSHSHSHSSLLPLSPSPSRLVSRLQG